MEIRLFIEGGGDSRSKRFLREGFHAFLKSVVDEVRKSKVRFILIICGTRRDAFDDFCESLKRHPDAKTLLLVDAEGPVTMASWQHLQERPGDNWKKPDGGTKDQCHFMVQLMESWFIADADSLESYYGQGFQKSAVPNSKDIETVEKDTVLTSLKAATRNTKTKGEYHKTRHAPDLLKAVNPEVVRSMARHCDRLFVTLKSLLAGSD